MCFSMTSYRFIAGIKKYDFNRRCCRRVTLLEASDILFHSFKHIINSLEHIKNTKASAVQGTTEAVYRGSTPIYSFVSCNGDCRTDILAYAFHLCAGGCISSELAQKAFTVTPHSLLCSLRNTSPDKRILLELLYHNFAINQYFFKNYFRSSPTFQLPHT